MIIWWEKLIFVLGSQVQKTVKGKDLNEIVEIVDIQFFLNVVLVELDNLGGTKFVRGLLKLFNALIYETLQIEFFINMWLFVYKLFQFGETRSYFWLNVVYNFKSPMSWTYCIFLKKKYNYVKTYISVLMMFL